MKELIELTDKYEITLNVYMNKNFFVICAPKVGSRFMENLWLINKTDVQLPPTFDSNNVKSLHISSDNLAPLVEFENKNGYDEEIFKKSVKKEEKINRDRSEEIISFLEIEDIKDTPVGKLPYGLQKKVELGRALATDSSIILLDEPMAGMNVEEKRDMCRFILKVNDELGTTMVLIEHDMGVVMDISDRVVVLDYGKVIGDGTPDEIMANQKVIDAYLGVAH